MLVLMPRVSCFIDEAEQIPLAPAGTLKVKASIELVSAAECLIQAQKKRVLMGAVKNRYLVVIERITRNVGCGIELQQRLGLGADRDHVAGKRLAGFGIVDDDGLSKRVDQIGKVAGTLRRRRDKAGNRSQRYGCASRRSQRRR